MLRTTRWRGGQLVADEAGRGRDRGDVDLVWIDLEAPTDDELHEVATKAVLHPLAAEDLSVPDERPKIEVYGDGTVVIEAAAPDLSPLGIVLQPGLVVTVRRPDRAKVEARWDLAKVEQRFARTAPKKATPGFLLYTLLDEVVDGHLDHLDAMGEQLEDLEDRIFGETLGQEEDVQQAIFGLRRALLVVRRRVEPLREVLSTILRGEVDLVGDELRAPFQDVLDHLLRAIDVVDSQRELLSGAVDAHLAMISNRMNQVMKKMTSWGAILICSTLVAGVYGMNFVHMPELRWRYGYAYALGLMAALTGALYTYFKRRNWL